MVNVAKKNDAGKPRMELLDPWVLIEVAKVLTHGAAKYSDDNWRHGLSFKRVIGAIKRHTAAIEQGEDIDPEFGLLHAAHLICEAMFLAFYQLHEKAYRKFDDRWRPVPKDDLALEAALRGMRGT